MKRRWKATAILPFGFSSTVPAGLAWSPPSRAEAEQERLYWQRRAVADRARAVWEFGRAMSDRVDRREVERAALEGQLACLRMLETVDQKTAEAISFQASEVQKRVLEDELFFAKPRSPGKTDRQVEALSQWICENGSAALVAPTSRLSREMLEQAFERIKRLGHDHAVIKNVTRS